MIAQSFKGLNYLRKFQWKPYKGDVLKKISNLREMIESLRTKLNPWKIRLDPFSADELKIQTSMEEES